MLLGFFKKKKKKKKACVYIHSVREKKDWKNMSAAILNASDEIELMFPRDSFQQIILYLNCIFKSFIHLIREF